MLECQNNSLVFIEKIMQIAFSNQKNEKRGVTNSGSDYYISTKSNIFKPAWHGYP